MINIQILRVIFFLWLFCCLSSPTWSEDYNVLKVVYPKSGGDIQARSTFIVGQVSPGNILTCNGQKVKVNQPGFFAHVVPLNYGANHFLLSCSANGTGNSVDKELTIYRKPPAKPISPEQFKIEGLRPNADLAVRPGDLINFSVHATPGSTVNLQLGGHLLKLIAPGASNKSTGQTPDVEYGKVAQRWDANEIEKNKIAGDVYRASYRVEQNDHFSALHAKATLSSEGKNISLIGKARISTLEEPIVVSTSKAPTVVRVGPGLARTTPLVEGIKVLVDGWSGDNMRCLYSANNHVWIKRTDVTTPAPIGTAENQKGEESVGQDAVIPQSVVRTINLLSDQYGDKVCLPLTERLPYQIEQRLSPNCLALKVYGASADTDWITSEPGIGNCESPIIHHVSWKQAEDNVYEVTIHMKGKRQWGYKIFYEGNTLCLSVKHPLLLQNNNDLLTKQGMNEQENTRLDGIKICLDPGHGGSEIGSIGCSGEPESQVNLEIATKAKSYLEDAGATVIMTRMSQNENVSLDERVRIATNAQADFLISIHNNALPDGRDPWQEHGTSSYWYHPQSIELARCLKESVKRRSGFPDLGARYQNLALARAPAMPSVLLEIGFMINPDEFAKLIDPQFQSKIAQAICDGIKQYISSSQ